MLTIVTGNSGKYRQIASVLEDIVPCVQGIQELIEPQSNDMYYVSAQKAKQAFAIVGGPVVVDDTGIFFDAYPDFPEVFSKYMFQSLGMDGLQRLFIGQENLHASFLCVLSYMDKDLLEPKQYIGTTQGSIDFSFLDKVTVDPHLPYLSIFVPEGMDTVAQMDTTHFEKNHHRTKASEALKEYIASSFI